jgi:RNA-directed DNA polymerase
MMPVDEDDGRGGTKRTTTAKDDKRGTPQGAPISPLLSNLYLRRFLLGWRTLGLERALKSCIVTYADDLVILCKRRGKADEASVMDARESWRKLKLTVNEEKTRICRIPEESSSTSWVTPLAGFTHRRQGKARIGYATVEEEHQEHGRKSYME